MKKLLKSKVYGSYEQYMMHCLLLKRSKHAAESNKKKEKTGK